MEFQINNAVVDLRREPVYPNKEYVKDLLQESQLIYGETVMVKEQGKEWSFVECTEQQKCNKDLTWTGYQGWILSNNLVQKKLDTPCNLIVKSLWIDVLSSQEISAKTIIKVPFGSKLCGRNLHNNLWEVELLDGGKGYVDAAGVRLLNSKQNITESFLRTSILENAKLFLGMPYLWGGRSPFCPSVEHTKTSLDCSGLTNLIYQFNGMTIPRDAHDQYLKSRHIESKEIKTGDLVFLASSVCSSAPRINHVMLNAGNDHLIESSMQPKCVRQVSFAEKIGKSLKDIKPGVAIDGEQVFFGTYF